jgi:ArsR family transcriptional regulator
MCATGRQVSATYHVLEGDRPGSFAVVNPAAEKMAKIARPCEAEFRNISKALGDRNRCGILQQIGTRDGIPLGEILEHLPISGATLSHHLKLLEAAELIEIVRDGRCAYLRLRREVLKAYSSWVVNF